MHQEKVVNLHKWKESRRIAQEIEEMQTMKEMEEIQAEAMQRTLDQLMSDFIKETLE